MELNDTPLLGRRKNIRQCAKHVNYLMLDWWVVAFYYLLHGSRFPSDCAEEKASASLLDAWLMEWDHKCGAAVEEKQQHSTSDCQAGLASGVWEISCVKPCVWGLVWNLRGKEVNKLNLARVLVSSTELDSPSGKNKIWRRPCSTFTWFAFLAATWSWQYPSLQLTQRWFIIWWIGQITSSLLLIFCYQVSVTSKAKVRLDESKAEIECTIPASSG